MLRGMSLAPHQVAAPLAALLDALPLGALLVDDERRVVHVNERLTAMMRIAAPVLVGQPVQALFAPVPDAVPGAGAPDGRGRLADFLVADRCPGEVEALLKTADGRNLPVVAAACATLPSLSGYHIVTVSDVAALKKAETRAREQYQQIVLLTDTVLEQAIDLKNHSKSLEKQVQQRTRALHAANMDAIYMLAVASEAKDMDTGAHVLRIRDYSKALGAAIGLPEVRAERIGYLAVLHDVGKMQVPDEILKKPGPLTPEERRIIEQHTVAGERILSNKPFFEVARQIARSHHEDWDGGGYPDGLRGEAIPLPARIVHLVDVFDALVSARVYKPPWPPEQAIRTIRLGAGKQFDPRLVEAFQGLVDQGHWEAIRRQQPDVAEVLREP